MKKIQIVIIVLLMSFTAFAQTKLVAPLVRNSPTDTLSFTHYDTLGRGGLMVFSSIANRNALPISQRKIGMFASVDTVLYQLKGGVGNGNWNVFKSGETTPTIQQVLEAGDTTTRAISFGNGNFRNTVDAYGINLNQDYTVNGVNYTSYGLYESSGITFNKSRGLVGLSYTVLIADTNSRGRFTFPNLSNDNDRYFPMRVNGVFADATGNITIPTGGGGGGVTDSAFINSKFDSLRVNAGTIEGRKNGVFVPQFVIPSSSNIYNSNGTLTSPRTLAGNGYTLTFDSTKLSIKDTTTTDGHLYDFNTGFSALDYNPTNVSSINSTSLSGVKIGTNDRNNLDTSNNIWVKNSHTEINSNTHLDINAKTLFPATYTATGTTGNQTINKNSGSVNIAPASTTLTVTNNMVTANTIVSARVSSNDATAEILSVVSVTNGFIITMATPATNETQIKFWITN